MIDIKKLHQMQEEAEQQQQHIYEKILYKCHHRIITVSKKGETFSFFVVPEFEFGMPKYHPLKCCHFLIKKLSENGFLVKYTHPNLLYISWDKKYVRDNTSTIPTIQKQIMPPSQPTPLPPTQHTLDYRPSGKLSSAVNLPYNNKMYNSSFSPGGGPGGGSGGGPMGSSGGSMSSGHIPSPPLNKPNPFTQPPPHRNTTYNSTTPSLQKNDSMSSTKTISWNPSVSSSSSGINTTNILPSSGTSNTPEVKKPNSSDFDSSQDLLNNLDLVSINF